MTETNNRAVTTHVDWTLRGRRENPEGLAVGATPKGTVVVSFGETSSGRTCLTGGTEGEREQKNVLGIMAQLVPRVTKTANSPSQEVRGSPVKK